MSYLILKFAKTKLMLVIVLVESLTTYAKCANGVFKIAQHIF